MIYDNPWYVNISPETGELDQDNSFIGENRHHGARKDLKQWLEKVGLHYHSPHKFRHGFAVFALKNARNIPQLKAISQNMMHSNISITDGIYGILSESDIRKQMDFISNVAGKETCSNQEEIISYLEKISEFIENNKTKFGSNE